MDDNLSILIKAILDENGIKQDIKDLDKIAEKYTLNFKASIDKGELINSIKAVLPKIIADVNKAYNLKLPIDVDDKILDKSVNQYQSAMKKMASELNKIQLSLDDKSYEAEIARISKSFATLSGDANEAKTHVKDLQVAYKQMVNATDDNTRIQAEQTYQQILARTKNELIIAQAEAKEYVDTLKVNKLRNDIQDWLKKNTAATKEAKEAMRSYLRMLDGDKVSPIDFKTVKSGFDDWDTKMRKAGKLGNSLTETFKQGAKSFATWAVSSGTVMEVVHGLRNVVQEVYDIDTAMTNLYKVTDETDSRYNKFLNTACDNAQRLGRSVSSLIEQSANWAKLGYNINESEQLAQVSSIYANVGEVDDATAVSDMVTAMKAFNIEASDAITIVNKYNKLGNEFATSAKELGDGLSRSASAMATAGTDINKTLAMIAGGSEITQNASEFGNFLKVSSMRIRGMKGELEELGETVDESVDSISKVQTQILNRTGGKVNIFDDMSNFRDYYDIMLDISKVYNDLSDPDRADLTEILFGKQRGNQGAALIQAFQSGQIQKALNATLNSDGSAMQEQERWLESLEAKIRQFEAAFQSLSNTVLDSDLLKWVVDFGTLGVKAVDGLVDSIGALGTIGVIGGGILGGKNLGILYERTKSNHYNCFEYALLA